MFIRCVGIIAILAMSAWASAIGVAAPRDVGFQKANTNPLVGVWRFESEVDRRANGSVVATITSKEKHGFIVYTADKFVSAVIMPSKRSWVLDSATRDQLATSADDGTAYAGRYEIDTRTETVTHVIGVSFEPAYERGRLERNYALRGDNLTLTGSYSSKGEKLRFAVHFQRSPTTEATQN